MRTSRRQLVHARKATGRRRAGRVLRLTVVATAGCLAFEIWAPSAGAATTSWPMPSLAGIRAWLTAWDAAPAKVPAEVLGSASGRTHQVPASVTRTQRRAAGTAPGKGPGQLPAYHAHGPSRHTITSGPDTRGPGFSSATSKLLTSDMTATQDVYQNANGTITRDVYSGPVNYQTSSGSYAPIDTTLTTTSGRWHEKANSLGVSFAPASGGPLLGSMDLGGGESYGFGLAGAATVTGTQSGSSVLYPGVLPETDLTETAEPSGLTESLVLNSPSAPSSWTFPLTLAGLTPEIGANGSVSLVNSAGTAEVVIPAGQAWDSSSVGHSGLSASVVPTSWQLVSYNGGPALQLSLPAGWLTSPSRVFPVTVDPSGSEGVTGTTYVETGSVDANHSTANLMLMGTYNGGTDRARTFLAFGNLGDVGAMNLKNYHVTAADLDMWDSWAYICSTPEQFDAFVITESWSLTSMSWSGPSTGMINGTLDKDAPAAACTDNDVSGYAPNPDPYDGGWMDMPLNSTGVSNIQKWTLGNSTNHGFSLRANSGTDSDEWKQFDGYNSPHPPYLEITYSADVAPQIDATYPQNNYNATSLTPELQAIGTDADNWPDSLGYYFAVYNSSGDLVANSTSSSTAGSAPGTVPTCSQSGIGTGWLSTADWTVPEDELSWGQVYYWVVVDCDGLEEGTSQPAYFTTQIPQPTVSQAAQNSGEQGVSPGASDYTTSVTDAQVSTVGPSLSIERYYDSDNFATAGAFGAGWSSILDMKVTPGLTDAAGKTDTVVVTYPDGSQVGFGENYNGSFTAPEGRYATLASISGGYTLTDKNDTVYSFTQPLSGGGYGITSITDALGNELAFTWSSGEITEMTSMASGRSLHIEWATPSGASYPHVSYVFTDPVSGTDQDTDLTWQYSYDGDDLTQVCPPIDYSTCTTYSYAAGTDFPDAVLGTGPHSYWRFDEASGTTAASSVLANEQTDAASYTNVTLGEPGPLAGSTATAAGFNGSSSYVTLPSKLVSAANYQSISVWFKTTTAGGVIFADSRYSLSSGTAVDYVPNLYVGTDGYLNAIYWDNTTSTMKSTAPVDNGQWHLAVLTCAGDTETLYVDGQEDATLTGVTVSNNYVEGTVGTLTNDYIGAGFIGNGWPDEAYNGDTGTVEYFDGSISDVGFWDRPLTEAEVTGLYQAGSTAAAQLSQITRPSGSVYSQVAYSTVTGAVSQVTDDNGGVWHIAPPTVAGSSQVYVSAVLGQDPADYWRLADTDTATAVNQVNGGTATYNDVTQGQSGPFADSYADTFNGSDSYVALPSGLVTSAGNQSISLWFKTTTPGGALFGSSNQPLGSGTSPTSWVPELYVDSNGDLEAEFWNGSADPIVTSAAVDNGQWHNVVLTSGTDSQSLYLDGALVGQKSGTLTAQTQPYVYVGSGFANKAWPNQPNTSGTATPLYFDGSISDVAVYNSDLTTSQVQDEWVASQASGGLTPVETQDVTDPGGHTVSYQMDPLNGDRIIAQTDALGNTTKYGYDTEGFQDSVTDPDGNVTLTGYDARGNEVSQTTCQDLATNDCSTEYMTYYPNDTSTALTPDPRNDLMLTDAGPGSTSATDPTYLTSYSYNSLGELTSETGPPVPGFPNGRTTTYTYSTSSTAAYDSSGQTSGTTPPGLQLTETTPGGAVTSTEYYSNGDVYQVTDPDGLRTTYTYDGLGRVLSQTVYSTSFPAGLTTTYAYNQMGEVVSETDPTVTDPLPGTPHTAQITTTYDADGDVLSQTVSDTTPASEGGDPPRTVTHTYNSHDQLASSTDGMGNTTTYTYDAYGNLASETDPAGNTIDYTYDPDGDLLTEVLANYSGTSKGTCQPNSGDLVESSRTYDPAGQLASITNAECDTTAYTYTGNGLVSTITSCSAWSGTTCGGSTYVQQANTYNAANQLVAQVTNNGKTTTDYNVDAAGRTQSQTLDPSGLDRTTTYSYSPDDAVLNESVSGQSGGLVSSTDYTYDPMGNMTSETVHNDNQSLDPSGWWSLSQPAGTPSGSSPETYAPDQSGNGNTAVSSGAVTWTSDGAEFAGDGGQGLTAPSAVVDTADSFSVSAWVNLAGDTGSYQGIVSDHSVSEDGFRLQYDAGNDSWAFDRATADTSSSPAFATADSAVSAQTGTWTNLIGTYDSSTGTLTLYVDGQQSGTATDSTPYQATGPLSIGNDQYEGSTSDWLDGTVADVQVYPYALSASQASQLYGEGSSGGALGEHRQTTSWTLDSRGLPTSMTDPNGNTTSYVYDQAGQLAETIDPTITTDVYGAGALATAPVSYTGYNTFGEPVVTKDPDGNEVFTSYDNDGRQVSVTEPDYTPPDGSGEITDAQYTTTYNALGEVQSQTDPLGNVTSYKYDQLGDVTSETTPAGTTSYTYDGNGDQTSVTSPAGAVTDATYDFLGRQVTSTQVDRYPSQASFTTTTSYGSDGSSPWPVSVTTPDGVVTSYGYDAAGEQTSVTDGAGNTTSYAYDAAGDLTKTTNPDGTYSTTSYDEAGNEVGQADYSSSGTLLRSDSATYDGDGNQLTATDYLGNTTSYSYNAMDELTGEIQPVSSSSSITTSFGYDADGDPTLYTDGDGNDWWTTYNSWGLPESQIEPETAAAPTAADSTFTTSYDADGDPVQISEPGGITITDSYNAMQELTGQSGSGASAATTSRSFGYNADGELTSASAPGGTDNFSYDDRGLLLSASGPSGTSSFTYNGDGLLSSVTDAAGTTNYTYDDDDRLATLSDPATGTTLSYEYNPESQVSQISYGSSGDVQDFGYNSLHELTSDTLQTASGQSVASISYGYDADGDLTSKDTTGFDGSADNTYTYNEAGELTSWDNGTTTTTYGYDGAGNRTQVGSQTYTYDARDELTSDGTSTYSYTMAGSLASVTGPSGTTNYTSDAFGQTITAGGQNYAYDALGRVVSDTGSSGAGYTFSYDGTSSTLASDGISTYTWDPTGTSLVGVGVVGGSPSDGSLALTDAHTDVVGEFTASSSALTGSATYDPLGDVLDSEGMAGQLGYQSAWTDPATGQVDMGARWYDPATGQFTSRDTVSVNPVPDSAAGNPFAYAADNPMTGTDPTGHMTAMFGGPNQISITPAQMKKLSHTPPPPPPPPPASSSPSSHSLLGSLVHDAEHVAAAGYDDVVHTAEHVYHTAVKVIGAATNLVADAANLSSQQMLAELASAVKVAGRVATDLETGVADASRVGTKIIGQGWHAVAAATSSAEHVVTRTAVQDFQASVHLVHTAVHDVAKAATATATFVKNHAAAIAGIVVSTAVFFGCEAAVGLPSGGVGAVVGAPECGALAGAAANAVSYGITAAQTGKFSWTGLAKTTLEGAAVGYLTGGLTMGAGGDIGAAADDLLTAGATADATTDATTAAAQAATDDGVAASADTADTATSTESAEEAPPGGTAAEEVPSRGVTFFDESTADYYKAAGATLGRPGGTTFFMSEDDSALVNSSSDAARYSGMAPSVQRAYVSGEPVYGVNFPTAGLEVRVPTAADAGGFEHFLEGGQTAVRLANDGGYLVNPVSEFVTPGGLPVPEGSFLFRLGPGGEQIPIRGF